MAGKNEATGDTIHLLFDAQKNAVKSLRLLGGGAMASGRYVDMEKAARQKKAAELDSLSKLAQDRIAKAAAKNDSTKKVSAPAPTEKVVAPAPKAKNGPAPAPRKAPESKISPASESKKKEPAKTEGKP